MAPARTDAPRPDPRERERWFQLLPPAHQERFRADWEAERAAWERLLHHRRLGLRSTLLAYALLLGLAHLFSGLASPASLLLFPLTGAALGALCWKLEAGALLSTSLAVLSFFAADLLFGSALARAVAGDAFGFARFAFIAYAVGAIAHVLPEHLDLR